MKKTSRAMEDFLEALMMLEEKGEKLETTKVAKILGVSKPAVHQMGHELIDAGYITRRDYGDIKLTEEGRALGEKIYYRHKMLTQILYRLGIPEEVAESDACKMEHAMSEETFEAIVKHAEKIL